MTPAERMARRPCVGVSRAAALGIAAAFCLCAGAGSAAATPLTDKGTQPLLSHALLPPVANCGACHGNFDLAHDIEPNPTWEGTMMAQAARDPLFWAALDVANNDVASVGEWCLRCHVPRGWYAGRAQLDPGGCGLSGKLDQRDNDFEGVDCHFCHRMEVNTAPPVGQQPFYLENGQVWLDDSDCGGQGEPCRHGPYAYTGVGEVPPPHPWAHSTYLEDSTMCGACHNVTSPVNNLIVNGIDAGIRFPIERTYLEWELSDFGPGPTKVECQGCHMPDATVNPAHPSVFQLNNRTGDMPMHFFVGGNAWIPDVLRLEYPALGIGGSLLATRARAIDTLQNQSATVEIEVPTSAIEGQDLDATVTVTNLTGHKLPTGYPEGRRMWLHVEARDGANALVFESGAYAAATGALTQDAQVKVYESKQGIWNGSACETEAGGSELFHFVLNDCVAKDNRIPPLGFTGGSNLEVRPWGYTYPQASPGVLVNYDTTSYTIPIPAGAVSPVTVTATLRFQTASREYVEFLRDQAVANGFPDDCIERTAGFPTASRGELLYDMWTAYGRSAPVDMGSASGQVAIEPAVPLPAFSPLGGLLLGFALAALLAAPAGAARRVLALSFGKARQRRPH
jgi:hypothetical protein